MKNITLIAFVLIIIGTSCKKDKSPNPTGSSATSGSLTPWENSLVGQWKLKREEQRTNAYASYGITDSTIWYINHYNYLNSQLDLTSTLSNNGQDFLCTIGTVDGNSPSQGVWRGGDHNSITFAGAQYYFMVQYLTADSLVLDFDGGQVRLFYNKSTSFPTLKSIETLLTGQPWNGVEITGTVTFNTNWQTLGSPGYNCTTTGAVTSNFSNKWEVICENTPTPVLQWGTYYKINNLTANSLTLYNLLANRTFHFTR